MQNTLIRSLAAAAALTWTAPVALHAQYVTAPAPSYQYAPQPQYAPPPDPAAQQMPPAQAAPIFDQAQLDQLLAPIALYPDQLLGQIVMAATYPAEVQQAAGWLQDPNNAALQGDALAATLEQIDWDPSIKSLVPFPSVIQMMAGQMQWTQNLGDAFLAQQGDVMESVQRLRHEAYNNGRLQSTPQQIVAFNGPDIVIEPANPNVVYVPYYDPNVVYGAWAYPDEPPYYFAPPPSYVYGPVVAGIGFGVGYGVFGPFWGWDSFDWRRHRVHVDADRVREIDRFHHDRVVGDTWQHDPDHRRGVTYRDPVSQQRFTRAAVNPQNLNRGNAGITNRTVLAPTQPGTTVQPGTQIQRFQGNPQTNLAPRTPTQPGTQIQRFQGMPQSNVTPGSQGPTVLRGGGAPPPTGPQGQVDPRFRGQMGSQTVVPQTRTVVPQGQSVVPQPHPLTPQYQQAQPRVITPQQPLQNRPVQQDRRMQP